ncbi:hypothetical protein F3J20_29730, partial [Paraburkholderia sp. Cy-641]|nr:hypothetical protein [Paraburkholderia sp. Cy-641]
NEATSAVYGMPKAAAALDAAAAILPLPRIADALVAAIGEREARESCGPAWAATARPA